jgi:hypothetical protein
MTETDAVRMIASSFPAVTRSGDDTPNVVS